MEYLSLGDLESRIRKPIPDPEARRICQQVLQGLVFMHRSNFAHRDLKPSNILVQHEGPNWWVKLSDFGTSKQIGSTALRTITGTEQYLAPELQNIYTLSDLDLVRDGTYSLAVDIWAVGAIAFRLTTGKLPFELPTSLFRYVQLDDPLPRIDLQTVECMNFVASTMNGSPRRRLTAEEALRSPWIQRLLPAAHFQAPEADAMPQPVAPPTDNAPLSIYSNTWSTINTVPQDERPRSEATLPNLMPSDETIRQDTHFDLTYRPPSPLLRHIGHDVQLKREDSSVTSTQNIFEKTPSSQFKSVHSYETHLRADSICLSPDGRWLAARYWSRPGEWSISRVGIWRYDRQLQPEDFQFLGHVQLVTWFAFMVTDHGKLVVVVRGLTHARNELRTWHLNGQDQFVLSDDNFDLEMQRKFYWDYSRVSSNGKMFVEVLWKDSESAYFLGTHTAIWEINSSLPQVSLRKVQDIPGDTDNPRNFYWSPDGRALLETPGTTYESNPTRLWKLRNGYRFLATETQILYPRCDRETVHNRGAVFSPNNRWVVIWDKGDNAGDHFTKLFNIGQYGMTETELKHSLLSKTATCHVAFSPDSQVLALSHYSGGITLWDIRAENTFVPITTLRQYRQRYSLAFSPDGESLVAASKEEDKASIHVFEISRNSGGRVVQ